MTFIFQVWVQARAKKQRNTLLIWRSIASHSDTAAPRTTLPSRWWVWWFRLEGIKKKTWKCFMKYNMWHVWVISGKGHCVFWFVSSSSTYPPPGGGGTGLVVKQSFHQLCHLHLLLQSVPKSDETCNPSGMFWVCPEHTGEITELLTTGEGWTVNWSFAFQLSSLFTTRDATMIHLLISHFSFSSPVNKTRGSYSPLTWRGNQSFWSWEPRPPNLQGPTWNEWCRVFNVFQARHAVGYTVWSILSCV